MSALTWVSCALLSVAAAGTDYDMDVEPPSHCFETRLGCSFLEEAEVREQIDD
jgi:hypothetical protein